MYNNFCPYCKEVTQHRKETRPWLGNLEKSAIYLVCTECNLEGSMWLEDKEEIND